MDQSDRTSENSSDSSATYWELVASAATIAAYEASMGSEVPLPLPGFGLHERENGRLWVAKVLACPGRSHDNFRMSPDNFYQLHDILVSNHGLRNTHLYDSLEGLAMFVWTVAKKPSQRDLRDKFGRGLGTVSQKFSEVLDAVTSFANRVLRPKDPTYSTVHEQLQAYSPLFDGCIGAIDGTHIKVRVTHEDHDAFINRKGWTSQNVVAVCDFDMHFTYVGVGLAGACHDMAVLRRAWASSHFPHPPPGRYYLVDSGYAGDPGYLTPHRQNRYQLAHYSQMPPQGLEELFNYHHSKLRNVIERSFGVLKSRWKILAEVPEYCHEKQSKIILSCFALHNYLVDMNHQVPGGNIVPFDSASSVQTNDMRGLREVMTAGLGIKLMNL